MSSGCNPLTGLFFLQDELLGKATVVIDDVAIPLRGFSFCKARNGRRNCLRQPTSCNPLTGLFFLQAEVF